MALRGPIAQIKEFPARMRPAGLFSDPRSKQCFVAAVVIDHQRALPAFEEGGGMFATATGLVIEDGYGRGILQIITPIRPG